MPTQSKPPGGPSHDFDHWQRNITGPIVPMDYEVDEMVEWYDSKTQESIAAKVVDIRDDQVEVVVDAEEWNEELEENEDVMHYHTVYNDQHENIRHPRMDYKKDEMVEWYDSEIEKWFLAQVLKISEDQVQVEVKALQWNKTLKKNEVVKQDHTVHNKEHKKIRRPPASAEMNTNKSCRNTYFV